VAHDIVMFEANPKGRFDLKSGTLYALFGESNWIYYGQVSTEETIGFFRRRDRDVASTDKILSTPLMSVIGVNYPSITRALRSGRWKKLGRFELAPGLHELPPMVHWPVGTLKVTVWIGGEAAYETRFDDPAIQTLELIASWDAEDHIPARLTADFGQEAGEWHIGGPIFRERKIKEELAARFPDQPWHALPPDWVSTSIR
jgi:hypothetical protein